MRRQMGMTLMIIGVFCFIVGFVFYSSPKKAAEPINQRHQDNERVSSSTSVDEPSSPPAVEHGNSPNSTKTPPAPSSSDELDKIISMAIVDGVLTPNERNLIKDFTNSRGLNYNVVIQDVEKRMAAAGVAETEMVDINKKNGDDFEKFVVQKFNKRFFKINEWAGDKYVNGRYAETTQHPDLLLEHSYKNETSKLAVECKWRSDFYKEGVVIASSEQLERYKEFEAYRKIPVFIAIGIGGNAYSPEQLYVVPLSAIKYNFITATYLKKFQKQIDKEFYFYSDSQKLM